MALNWLELALKCAYVPLITHSFNVEACYRGTDILASSHCVVNEWMQRGS